MLETKCQENSRAIAQQIKTSGSSTASAITYDNTSSRLTADDVQEAIDELASRGVKYSTTEKVIGKWTDGSDVYQRTFILEEGVNFANGSNDLPDALQTALASATLILEARAISDTASVAISVEFYSDKWTAYYTDSWNGIHTFIFTYLKAVTP